MEGLCINVSYVADDVATFPSKCAAIGATAFNNYSTGVLFLMKVFFQSTLCENELIIQSVLSVYNFNIL